MKIFRAEPLRWHSFHGEEFGLVDSLFVRQERPKSGFNRRMFDEDFARLFRSLSHRSDNLFEIVSNDDELVRKLLSNVQTRYAPHPVDRTIRQLVEEIAQSLIWSERAYYYVHDDVEQEEIHVAPFRSDGVVSFFGMHIQWVPTRTERSWDRDDQEIPRELRILDTGKVMRFELPKSMKRMLAKQNKTLAVLDKYQFGVAYFQSHATHETPHPTSHFDFSLWKDTQKRALYSASRSTGWSGRDYDASKCSDFFICHRLIRFRRNQLMLRDEIMRQLSFELSRVGKSYKAEFSVEISGTNELPSVEHLSELEERLVREEVGFGEIIDYCYEH